MQRFMKVGTILCLVAFLPVVLAGPPGFPLCGPDVARAFWWNAMFDWSFIVAPLCLFAPALAWSVYEYRLDRTARVLMLLPVIVTVVYAVALAAVYAETGVTLSCLIGIPLS
jgi:hypothetical protein